MASQERKSTMTTQPAAGSRLGRGLATLIGEVEHESGAPAPSGIRTVATAFLRPNPHNPRKNFDDGALDELTASVREKGVVQPLIVRVVGEVPNSYEIIAGERRWRAAQRAGLHDVPVIVRDVSDREALELAIIENVQRADLNALEEAIGYRELLDQYAYSQSELAAVIGKSRPHISNTLRLLKLPHEVQELVRSGELTAGHARALVNHDNPIVAARRIVASGLSVRDTEARETRRGKARRADKRVEKDADTLALEKLVGDNLGLAVTIDDEGGRGSVQVRYGSLEQLDEICRRLQVRQ